MAKPCNFNWELLKRKLQHTPTTTPLNHHLLIYFRNSTFKSFYFLVILVYLWGFLYFGTYLGVYVPIGLSVFPDFPTPNTKDWGPVWLEPRTTLYLLWSCSHDRRPILWKKKWKKMKDFRGLFCGYTVDYLTTQGLWGFLKMNNEAV